MVRIKPRYSLFFHMAQRPSNPYHQNRRPPARSRSLSGIRPARAALENTIRFFQCIPFAMGLQRTCMQKAIDESSGRKRGPVTRLCDDRALNCTMGRVRLRFAGRPRGWRGQPSPRNARGPVFSSVRVMGMPDALKKLRLPIRSGSGRSPGRSRRSPRGPRSAARPRTRAQNRTP